MANDMVGNYLKKKAYGSTASSDLQVIPSRHGVATFVPNGSTITIVNTSGSQVVDTWAFALPNPPENQQQAKQGAEEKPSQPEPEKEAEQEPEPPKQTPKKAGRKSKSGMDLPSQEDAEKATAGGIPEGGDAAQQQQQQKKAGWSSYLPSMSLRGGGGTEQQKKQTKENSRTWGNYFSAGKGFTNYIPSSNDVSSFATSVSNT